MTILVVDDDQAILKYLYRALTRFEYTVITAENAEEALSKLPELEVNLIISDIDMPGMNGNELCQVIREREDLDYIPIILLTALSSVDDLATGLVSGADDYLTKPVRLEELLRKIQEYAM